MPLPEYTVRRNVRARRILLKVLPGRGLVVVLPPLAEEADARRAVREHQAWAEEALERLAREDRLAPAPRLPQRLVLPALGFDAAVSLLPRPVRRPALAENAGRIELRLDLAAEAAPQAALELLRRYVFTLARRHLPARLRELSRSHGLPFADAHVRAQRRRWGSCSADDDIQINCKLLFLPPELVDHVLLHELCHTRIRNHGPRFHALLEAHSPGSRLLERRLAEAGGLVPDWMETP